MPVLPISPKSSLSRFAFRRALNRQRDLDRAADADESTAVTACYSGDITTKAPATKSFTSMSFMQAAQDGVECRVVSPRRRPRQASNNQHTPSPPPPAPDNQVVLSNPGRLTILDGAVTAPSLTHGNLRGPQRVEDAFRLLQLPHLATDTLAFRSPEVTDGYFYIGSTFPEKIAFQRGDGSRQGASHIPRPSNKTHRSDVHLPEYIKAFEVQAVENLEVLRKRSVFVLLPPELEKIVLDNYGEFLHPLLPIINFAEFCSAVSGKASGKKVSLLLYHAVMFFGLSCVESNAVLRLSHIMKPVAREASYEKAKTLLDLDLEDDRIVICQASLLLTGHDNQFDPKDATYWIGNAISQAHVLRLYRLEQSVPGNRKPNIRRILWWCILLKECDISMCMDQPPRVYPFSSQMLAMSDFGLGEPDITRDSGAEEGNNPMQTPAIKAASVCILKAKLYVRIYRIIRNMYEEIQPWNGQQTSNLLPGLRQEMTEQLASWYSDVPSELRYENLKSKFNASQSGITWAMAMLEITYLAAHILVYMDDLQLHTPENKRREFAADRYSRLFLRCAANQIAGVLEKVLACNMSEFLPLSALVHLLLAAFVHSQDTTVPDPAIRQSSLRNLEVCLKVTQNLADTYPTLAKIAIKFQPTAGPLPECQAERQKRYLLPPENPPSSINYTPTSGGTELGPDTPQPRARSSQEVFDTNSRVNNSFPGLASFELGDDPIWIALS